MEKIYHRLLKEKISANQMYLLWSMREGVSPVGINQHLEMRGLSPDWIEDGRLTGRSLSLLMDIDEMFKGKVKSDAELMGKDAGTKIEEYRLIFPEIKLPSGKYARESAKNLEVNFKWFFKTHKYDWDTILKATQKYVDEYAVKNYEYMRTAKYYIKKSDKSGSITSDLADYCERIVKGETDEPESFSFTEKVV